MQKNGQLKMVFFFVFFPSIAMVIPFGLGLTILEIGETFDFGTIRKLGLSRVNRVNY